MNSRAFSIIPIGTVRKSGDETFLEIDPKYDAALLNVEKFSHFFVLWWLDKRDTPEDRATLQTTPHVKDEKGTNAPLSGVFTNRSPARPNPIALSIVRLLKVRENNLLIDRIDADDGSFIIDIKPYLPPDRIFNLVVPSWFKHLKRREG
ncbi:MAG: TrmO family methyltransferase [Candidatus Hermodarchaeota archaeon]